MDLVNIVTKLLFNWEEFPSFSYFITFFSYKHVVISREFRKLRHKVHIGLFLSFIMESVSWIISALSQVKQFSKTWRVDPEKGWSRFLTRLEALNGLKAKSEHEIKLFGLLQKVYYIYFSVCDLLRSMHGYWIECPLSALKSSSPKNYVYWDDIRRSI